MRPFRSPALVRFTRTSLGISSLEYALVVAAITLAVMAGLAVVGDEIRAGIESIADRVPGIVAPG